MVKHLTWRDLSWSTTNIKANAVVNNSRTEYSLPKTSTTTKSVSNTSQSNQKPTQSNLSSKIRNTEGNSLLQSKEILVTRSNQTFKSKKTDRNEARSRNQTWSSQQASLGAKATQEVNLSDEQKSASASASKQPRKASTSSQVDCHSHAGYKHCGVVSTGQDSMMVGLVGGYTALALIVAVSLISIWASKYLPFFLKMWWIKASSAQT